MAEGTAAATGEAVTAAEMAVEVTAGVMEVGETAAATGEAVTVAVTAAAG